MSIDLWADLLGKARRRQLEGQVKVAAGPLLAQVGGGLLTAAAVSHFGPGAGSLASAFLGGAMKFGPPSGLMTPVADGTIPLIPAIVQAVSTLANKPKAAAQAKADQATQAAQAQADANQAAAEAAANRSAEKILNAQQQAIAQQQEADALKKLTWEADVEQIAEIAIEKYLERTGKFSPAELGKVEEVVGEAENVAEELPQTGVVGAVTEALHTAKEFVTGLVTKTEDTTKTEDAAPAEEAQKEATT